MNEDLNTLWESAKPIDLNGWNNATPLPLEQPQSNLGNDVPQAPSVPEQPNTQKSATAMDYLKSVVPFMFDESKQRVTETNARALKELGNEIKGFVSLGGKGLGVDDVKDTIKTADKAITLLQHKDNLFKDFIDPKSEQDVAKNQLKIIDSMEKLGFEVRPHSNGKLYLIDGDNVHELQSSTIRNIISNLDAEKYSIIGDLIGANLGYRAVKNLKPGNPYVKGLTTLGGMAAGAGATSALGSYIDSLSNALRTNEEFNLSSANTKALDTGVATAVLLPVASGVAQGLKSAVTAPLKFILDKTAGANIHGAEAFMKRAGVSTEKAQELANSMARYENTEEAFFKDMGQRQDTLLAAANTNEALANQVSTELGKNVKASNQVLKTIDERAKNIINSIESSADTPKTIQNNIKDYERFTKQQYKETKEVLQEMLPNERWNIQDSGIIQRIADFENIVGSVDGKASINALANRLERKGAMTISDLIDTRAEVNSILDKQRGFIGKQEIGGIKQTIDNAINNMIAKTDNPQEIKQVWEKSVDDYRVMKELQDEKVYKNIMNKNITPEQASNALLKHSQSIGDTLNRFVSVLPKEQQAKAEMRVLAGAIDKFTNGQSYTNQVVNLPEVVQMLKGVKFTTLEAKQMADTLVDMSKLFQNDVKFYNAAQNVKAQSMNQGLSWNVVVRARTMLANQFMGVMSKFLVGEAGQSAAFRHHVAQSFSRSRTPKEFLDTLSKNKDISQSLVNELRPITKSFDNNEKEIIELSSKELQKEKRGIWNVTFNGKSASEIRTRDLDDVIKYEKGSQKYGATHIVRKHLGENKFGGVTKEELLSIGNIIRNGDIPEETIRNFDNGAKSYAYVQKKGNIEYRVAVYEEPNGKKVITTYSNRKGVGTHNGQPTPNAEEASPLSYLNSSSSDDIIPQKLSEAQKYLNNLRQKLNKEKKPMNFSPLTKQILQTINRNNQ